MCFLNIKQKIKHLQFTIPENLHNIEDRKRDTYGSNEHGKWKKMKSSGLIGNIRTMGEAWRGGKRNKGRGKNI